MLVISVEWILWREHVSVVIPVYNLIDCRYHLRSERYKMTLTYMYKWSKLKEGAAWCNVPSGWTHRKIKPGENKRRRSYYNTNTRESFKFKMVVWIIRQHSSTTLIIWFLLYLFMCLLSCVSACVCVCVWHASQHMCGGQSSCSNLFSLFIA